MELWFLGIVGSVNSDIFLIADWVGINYVYDVQELDPNYVLILDR